MTNEKSAVMSARKYRAQFIRQTSGKVLFYFGVYAFLILMALIVLSIGLLNRIDRTPAKEGSAKW